MNGLNPSSSRTILITGAAQGIGAGTARWFRKSGVRSLVLVDRAGPILEAVAKDLRESADAPTVETCVMDIGRREAMATELRPLLERQAPVDVLVNSAGIADENEPEDVDAWHRILNVNLHGAYYATVEALRWMPDGGRIINVSSLLGRAGKIRNTAYCASKHALLGFTKGLALDLASRRITVNAVLPGWVDTPMLQRELHQQAAFIGSEPEHLIRKAQRQMPLKRFVTVDEVAALIGFLGSDDAAGLTAQGYTIDGGYTCGM